MEKMNIPLQSVTQELQQLNNREIEWIILSILLLDMVDHSENHFLIYGLMESAVITTADEESTIIPIKQLKFGDELITIKENYSSKQETRRLIEIVKKRNTGTTIIFLTLYLKNAISKILPTQQQSTWNIVINSIISSLLTMKILTDVCGYDEYSAEIIFLLPKSIDEFSIQVYDRLRNLRKSHSDINRELVNQIKGIESLRLSNNPIISILRYINFDYLFIYLYLLLKNKDEKPTINGGIKFDFTDDDINAVIKIYFNTTLDLLLKNKDKSKLVKNFITSTCTELMNISPSKMVWLDESSVPKEYFSAYMTVKQKIQKEQLKSLEQLELSDESSGYHLNMTMLNGIQQQN